MTAEQYLDQYFIQEQLPYSPEIEQVHGSLNAALIGFAKDHVQKALKQAAYNAKVRITEDIELANITQHYQIRHGKYVICDKESILNAYPIENIK